MKASQSILSALQIPYPAVPNGADPQKIINDFTGALLLAYSAIKAGTYKSPDNLPLPSNLPGLVLTPDQVNAGVTIQQAIATLAQSPVSQWSDQVIAAQRVAVDAYHALTTSGNLAAIHQALDAINSLSPLTKEPIIDAYPDLLYLQCASGVIGNVAQQCGPGGVYFLYGADPVADAVIASALSGSGPASMQPTVWSSAGTTAAS